jgi:hypothetical protein
MEAACGQNDNLLRVRVENTIHDSIGTWTHTHIDIHTTRKVKRYLPLEVTHQEKPAEGAYMNPQTSKISGESLV